VKKVATIIATATNDAMESASHQGKSLKTILIPTVSRITNMIHTVVGETPNIAARLQTLAEPETVVIAPIAAPTARVTSALFGKTRQKR